MNKKPVLPNGGRDLVTGKFVKGAPGRPKGAKSKQTKNFQQEIYNDWEKNGNGSLRFLQQMAEGTHPMLAEMSPINACKLQLDCIKQLMSYTLSTNQVDDKEDDVVVMSPAEALQALADAKTEMDKIPGLKD